MKRNPWVEDLFRPLAIGGMVGCVALSVVALVRLFAPTWNGTYLVVGCVLAALEASYSYRLIRARKLRTDVLQFRAVEIATFFILLKIGSYVGHPWADVLADVQTWPRQPWNILDPETTVAFILALVSWRASTHTVQDLEQINEPPGRYRGYVPPIHRLTSRFFWGGAVLLIVAGITRLGVAALLNLRRPSVPGIVLNVLVYFLLGLVMLGQVHFTSLRNRWEAQRVRMADQLPRRWARYSLAFISLAALVAFVLPTGYSVGLLDTGGMLIRALLNILSLLGLILLLLISLMLAPLARLLGADRVAPRDLPQLEFFPSMFARSGGTGPGWFEVLRSLLFWVVALGMVVYVVRSYLRDHPELLEALGSVGPIRALQRFLLALWRWLAGFAEAVNERIPGRLSLRRARGGRAGTSFHFFRLGALPPRERILYYYLSILRRAERQGFPRHGAQTPHEYDAALGPHLPEARQEMGLLTETFVEARYSRHAFDRGQEKQARSVWQRIKEALRALRRAQ